MTTALAEAMVTEVAGVAGGPPPGPAAPKGIAGKVPSRAPPAVIAAFT